MRRLLTALMLAALAGLARAGTLIDLRVDVQTPVPNDLGRAQMYVEMTGASAPDLAGRIKDVMRDALAAAKSYHGVSVKTGAAQTWPQYGKGARAIEGWRMRSDLWLESADPEALSVAVGALQQKLMLAQLGFAPSPATRTKAIEQGELDAVRAFQAHAANIAGAMNSKFKIKTISLLSSGPQPPHVFGGRTAAMMASDAPAPMPVEAGESSVSVTASGQIELE